MQLKIEIHSFVDVITNSSSEIYVQASDRTIKQVKKMVESLLKLGGSNIKATDIFTFELVDEKEEEINDYLEQYKDEIEEARKNHDEAENGEFDPKEWLSEEGLIYYNEDEDYRNISMLVKYKGNDPKTGKIAEEILSDLSGLFYTQASYG